MNNNNHAQIPRWMKVLVGEKFYEECSVHSTEKKNLLCLDCCIVVCPHCLDPHLSHHLLQIRRYLYKDVIRLEDAEKLLDCSSIQPYSTNRAKVVFLKHRPQARPSRSSGNVCMTCNRCLQHSFFFCSLSCKVMHLLKTKGTISDNLVECNFFPLSSSTELEYDHIMSPDWVFEPEKTSSGSTNDVSMEWFRAMGKEYCSGEVVKEKPSGFCSGRTRPGPVCSTVVNSPVASGSINRRKKSAPRRSPMY